MEKLINKTTFRLAFCTAMVALVSLPAFAQVSDTFGQQVLDQSSNALVGIVSSVVRLLRIVLGLGALVTLAMVIFNVMKGEREAATKVAAWVIGLTIGFVLLSVVQKLVMTA